MSEREHATREQPPHGGRRPLVVVGVDGSPASREALRRGLAEAASRGADVEAVVAAPAASSADAEQRLHGLVEEVVGGPTVEGRDGAREVAVRLRVLEGRPAEVLVDAAAEADLLVVGSRGRGAVRSALLGSVALRCVTHARCPVLVVHELGVAPTTGRPLVLVGADGSETAPAVVEEAEREAARLGGDLDVVTVFSLREMWGDPRVLVPIPADEMAARLRADTEEVVAGAQARTGVPAPRPGRTSVTVVEGAPREVLVDAARGATVLVVGSSGSGVLRGALIGSVALHCAVHAPCPVLVVPTRPGVPVPRPDPLGDRAVAAGTMPGRTP